MKTMGMAASTATPRAVNS